MTPHVVTFDLCVPHTIIYKVYPRGRGSETYLVPYQHADHWHCTRANNWVSLGDVVTGLHCRESMLAPLSDEIAATNPCNKYITSM